MATWRVQELDGTAWTGQADASTTYRATATETEWTAQADASSTWRDQTGTGATWQPQVGGDVTFGGEAVTWGGDTDVTW